MAEKIVIGAKEPLYKAAEKINGAMDEVNTFQTQIDQLVVEGDSSVEAAQARVDADGVAHPTLKARVDFEHNEVTAQLAQTNNKTKNLGIDVLSDFDINPSNASEGLTNALEYAKQNGYSRIVIPKSEYVFYEPIIIDFDDLELDFQGSKVIWKGNENLGTNNGVYRDYGFIYIKGEREYQITQTIINYHPRYNVDENTHQFGGIEFDTSPSVNIGEFVELDFTTGSFSGGASAYKPSLRTMCEVVGFDGNVMLIDYVNPFNWDTPSTKTVYKVSPVKNVKVSNLNYYDETPIFNGTPSASDRESWVSAISIKYGHNININNVNAKGHKFPAINLQWVNRINVRDCYMSDPSETSGGCGYALQSRNSTNVNITNFYGRGNRHLIDFAFSSFCNVTNSGQRKARTLDFSWSNFDLHGNCEHDISYNNCYGSLLFGNGWTEFPMIIANITLNNHKGFLNLNYVENLKISNSDVGISTWSTGYVNDLFITNSNVKSDVVSFVCTSRNGYVDKRSLKITNSELELYNHSRTSLDSRLIFNGYRDVNLSGLTLRESVNSNTLLARIEFNNCLWTKINNSSSINVPFNFISDQNVNVIRVNNVDFRYNKSTYTGDPYFTRLDVDNSLDSESVFYINLDGNTIVNQNESKCRFLHVQNSSDVLATLDITLTNNDLMTRVADQINIRPNFNFNVHGNFTGGLVESRGVLSKGVRVLADDLTSKNIQVVNDSVIVE